MKFKKTLFFVFFTSVFFFLSMPAVNAADFRFPGESGSVSVNKNEVAKNLYAAGNLISIDGEVNDDLYAAGSVININGNVDDNFAGAGASIFINGNVGGNVHVAGGSVIVEGDIDKDLFIAGGDVTITDKSTISGDLVVAGGNIRMEGVVFGKALVNAGEVFINGRVNKLLSIESGKVEIGKFTEIRGDMIYASPQKANIDQNAQIDGKVEYKKKAYTGYGKKWHARNLWGILSLMFLLKVIAFIITGLILVYLFRDFFKKSVEEGVKNIWSNLGIGVAGFIVIPIFLLLLMITVLGMHFSFLLLIVYILILILAYTLASFILGSVIMKMIKKENKYLLGWQEVVAGSVLLMIISLIPFVGWILSLGLFLISLGVLILKIYKIAKPK